MIIYNIADRNNSFAVFYDPMHGEITEAAHQVQCYINVRMLNWGVRPSMVDIDDAYLSKQTDGSSCGVFVLAWLQEVVRVLSTEGLSVDQMHEAIFDIDVPQDSIPAKRKEFMDMIQASIV
jgi:hypothetical protein